MFCGVSSFNHADGDELSSPSTPRGSKKKHSSTNNKNPYASRGLEKYNSVLSELEAKKEKIVANSGSVDGDVPVVRFMYSKSQNWVPIVVRLRDENSGSPLSPKKAASAQSKLKAELSSSPSLPSPKTKVRKHVTWGEGDGGRTDSSCVIKNA